MTSLTSLSDKELAAALHELAGKECASTIKILIHLAEFERRDLHLRLGYPSMFEYCTRGLGYSESSAVRRIQTARMARRFPQIYRAIERKELTVVTASMLSSVVTRDNVDKLIEAARGKLQRDVKGIVAALRPSTAMIRDRVIPLVVPAPAPVVLSILASDGGGSKGRNTAGSNEPGVSGPAASGDGKRTESNWQASYRHNGGKNPSTLSNAVTGPDTAVSGGHAGGPSTGVHPVATPPAAEKRFKFEFGASQEFMKKFSRVQSLISNKIPVRMTFEVLFECLMDEYLERNDPEKRAQRREIRRAKAEASHSQSQSGAVDTMSGANDGTSRLDATDKVPRSCTNDDASRSRGTTGETRPGVKQRSARHIPAAVRDKVFARDDGRCTFTGSDGVRCNATRNLQIDHVKPFALGGGNQASNLRLLCAKHNLLQARRTFGADQMAAYHRRE